MPEPIRALADLHDRYDTIFCDVWGVVHNGVAAYPAACRALAEARRAGLVVVLITNSPRPFPSVARQLEGLGVPTDAFDSIVTSGDVTRALIAAGPKRIVFLGPERDRELLDGLDVAIVEEDAAESIVCTGLFDDETEVPEDYRGMLEGFAARGLPFICANPDIVVERGDKLVYCAGALAALYRELGGETRISGKPHAPIYEATMAVAADVRGAAPDPVRILGIGDGLATDVRGALDFGLDVLYVANGIHGRDYADADGRPDPGRLAAFLADKGLEPRYWIGHLA